MLSGFEDIKSYPASYLERIYKVVYFSKKEKRKKHGKGKKKD